MKFIYTIKDVILFGIFCFLNVLHIYLQVLQTSDLITPGRDLIYKASDVVSARNLFDFQG